jgi:hypothetical protein
MLAFRQPDQARITCLLVLMTACVRQGSPETSAAPPAPLIVVSTATDVRRTLEYDGAVHYLVEDPYPGSITIDLIANAIDRTPDWKPSPETPLSKDEHDARSWWSYYETSGSKVYQWTGAWQNQRGDMVTYVLRYEVSDPNAVARTMKVSALYTTAATVAQLRKAARF